ncbi:MAG: hypothetical protein V7699_04085 [Porticoccus sp.]
MKTKIAQLIEKLCAEKHSEIIHCDVSSSRVQMLNIPISIELFRMLKAISLEYNHDANCLAGDILTIALEEAIEHIPREEKTRLDEAIHEHEREDTIRTKKFREFDPGGT